MVILITLLLGLFFLVGAMIIKFSNQKEMVEHLSVAMAFGAMVALAVFDLIPEIMESYGLAKIWIAAIGVILGIGFLKVLDHFIPEHNDDDEEETEENLVHIGLITAVAIVLHNIVEGMTVYSMAFSSYGASLSLGIGIGLHNVPMGMLIYATLQKEPRFKKYMVFGAAGLSTCVGGLLMKFISGSLTEGVISFLISIALGMVIYITIFELMPSVRHAKDTKLASLGAATGLVIVMMSMLLE